MEDRLANVDSIRWMDRARTWTCRDGSGEAVAVYACGCNEGIENYGKEGLKPMLEIGPSFLAWPLGSMFIISEEKKVGYPQPTLAAQVDGLRERRGWLNIRCPYQEPKPIYLPEVLGCCFGNINCLETAFRSDLSCPTRKRIRRLWAVWELG